jgi:hypothetical protein
MLLGTFVFAAAAAIGVTNEPVTNPHVLPAIVARCERSAFQQECMEAGEIAVRSKRLVRTCKGGADELRFSEQERRRFGYPTQAAIDAKCGDIGAACVANWKIYIDRWTRRMPDGRARLTEQEIAERAQEECSLNAAEIQLDR